MIDLIDNEIVNTQCSDSTVFHKELVCKPSMIFTLHDTISTRMMTEHKAIAICW